MDTLMSLQKLEVTVNGLKENIDLENRRVLAIMNSNNDRASGYHSKFGELLKKYSGFAAGFKYELDTLHKGLLNGIETQQKQRAEQERLFQEKLETLSNKSNRSNLEIVENVEETEYNSSAANYSIPHSPNNNTDITMNHSSDPETENVANIVSVQIPSNPQQMKAKKSVPISAPKPKPKPAPAPQQKRKSNNNKQNKMNKKKVTTPKKKVTAPAPEQKQQRQRQRQQPQQQQVPSKAQPKPNNAATTKTTTAPVFVRTITQQKNEAPQDKPYEYKPDKIRFSEQFDFSDGQQYKHSTSVFIGNIPSNIKIKAVEYFIVKRAEVTLRHFSFDLKKGARSQYALVNFRYDVGMNKILKFMNDVNSENAQILEDKKKNKDAVPMKKSAKNKENDDKKRKEEKKLKTSWQTRVYIKLPEPSYHYTYYETEDEMYNDPNANHQLFIKNFDILNEECHQELTEILLSYGDLFKDIDIRLDRSGDPYCIAIFKYINDAIYCCNDDIVYNDKRLDMRYSKF